MESTATQPASSTKKFGALTIVAQVTTDGAYSINTFTGPHREANLCYTTADRDTFRLAYRIIAEGGLNGVRPDGIHEALRENLTHELHRVQRRTDTPSQARIEHLNRLLDLVDPPKPRTFADLKVGYAAGIARQRNERAGVSR